MVATAWNCIFVCEIHEKNHIDLDILTKSGAQYVFVEG